MQRRGESGRRAVSREGGFWKVPCPVCIDSVLARSGSHGSPAEAMAPARSAAPPFSMAWACPELQRLGKTLSSPAVCTQTLPGEARTPGFGRLPAWHIPPQGLPQPRHMSWGSPTLSSSLVYPPVQRPHFNQCGGLVGFLVS